MMGSVHSTTLRIDRTRANTARASAPDIGAWVPAATLHVFFLIVAVALCLLMLEDFWLVGGLLLAVIGTFMPNLVHKGCVILVLALSQLWRDPSVTDATFYLLLAGVHLLHVVGSLVREMPWHARVQALALVRPLRRFVLVQVVVQCVAGVALFTFGVHRGSMNVLPIFSAVMLSVVAAILGRGLQRVRARGDISSSETI